MKLTLKYFIILFFTGILIYANSFDNQFVYDDQPFIVNNQALRHPLNLHNLFYKITTGQPTRWVGFLTFYANYQIHGLNVFGYHLVNFLIHLLNTVLVYLFCLKLFSLPAVKNYRVAQHKNSTAFLISLLFITHPVQTQAISYISQRVESLASLFYLATLLCYLQARHFTENRNQKIIGFSLAGLFATLGIFTKEITVTIPISILALEIFFHKNKEQTQKPTPYLQKIIISIAALGLISIIPLILKMRLGMFSDGISSLSHDGDILTLPTYLLTQLRVIATFIRLWFWPVNQNLDYDFPMSHTLFEPETFLAFLFLTSLIIFALTIRRKNLLISYGIFFFFIVISANLFPRPFVIFEHKLYLPSLGLALALIAFLTEQTKNFKTITATVVGICCIFGLLAINRNQVWQNSVSLWTDVTQKSPQKAPGFLNLGAAYVQINNDDQAIKNFNEAIKINPQMGRAYNSRGVLYFKNKKYDLAENDFRQALKLTPLDPEPKINLANLFKIQGKNQEALALLNEFENRDLKNNFVLINRSLIYYKLQDYEKALLNLNRAISLDPDLPDAYLTRANVYKKLNRSNEALADYNRTIELEPKDSEFYFKRGIFFMDQKEYPKALQDFETCLRLNPQESDAFYNIASILNEQNRDNEAMLTLDKLIQRDPSYINAYFLKAYLHLKSKQWVEAENIYSGIIKNDPQNGQAYYFRAAVYQVQKDYPKALADLNMAKNLGYPVPPEEIILLENSSK